MNLKDGLQIHETYVNTVNGKLFTRISGSGKPILMIHGVASDAEYFKDSVSMLQDDYMVITYDRNGHSRSKPKQDADFSIQGETEDAIAVLGLIPEDKVIIVGVSAGSSVALELALMYPDRTDQLILYEPAFCFTKDAVLSVELYKAKISRMAKEGRTPAALLTFVEMIGGLDPVSPPVSEKQQLYNFKNFRFYLDKQLKDLRYGSVYVDKLKELEKSQVSCHILVGTEDKDGLFCRSGKDTAELLGVTPVFVKGFHNYPKDHPDEFADYIKKHILSQD